MIRTNCKKKIVITLLGGLVLLLPNLANCYTPGAGKPPKSEAWSHSGACYYTSYVSCDRSQVAVGFTPPGCNISVSLAGQLYAPACEQGAYYGWSAAGSPTQHTCFAYLTYTNPCTGKKGHTDFVPSPPVYAQTPDCAGNPCAD
jgi:hypothetical protein